ncbi:LysR family transcriptional regulator [uncultured Pseudacidovorax sp.]|uniref:LysR family transcriptional regulator n=1 Tax=uncultured Pseudacidovorax sp. TaxID=679313 RepID=UPI0025F62AD3|nr:LysR family transcriptional regulator [uncultured Pseudacidovorax sp.]
MLDLRRLQLLRDLSVLGTIGRVAEARGLTRPAVSQQLARLEEEAGAVLFERSGRGVKLTATGERLVSRTGEVFGLLEAIEAELGEQTSALRGQLRLCAFGSAANGLLPDALGRLAREHPELDVFATEEETRDGLRAAASKQVDIAIVDDLTPSGTQGAALEFTPLCRDTFHAVLPARHPLASRRLPLRLADLADERWVSNMISAPYHQLLMTACGDCGFTPRVRGSFRNLLATLELVRSGGFVSVLPYFAVCDLGADARLAVRPITPTLGRGVLAAYARGSGGRPAVAAALRALQAAVGRIESARDQARGPQAPASPARTADDGGRRRHAKGKATAQVQ